MAKLNKSGYELLGHMQCFPDLAPSDIFGFQIWKNDSEERD